AASAGLGGSSAAPLRLLCGSSAAPLRLLCGSSVQRVCTAAVCRQQRAFRGGTDWPSG
ncbi:hypothetical protein KUCAC02_010959, partial [Chaenocephalus aceratus]